MNTAEKISRLEQMLERVRSNRERPSSRGAAPVPAQSAAPAPAPRGPRAAEALAPPSSEAVTERRGALGSAAKLKPAAAAPPAPAKPDRSDDVEITIEDAGSPDIEIVETDLEDVTDGEAFGMAQEQLHEMAAAPDAIVTSPRPGPPDDAGLGDVTLPALDHGLPKGLEPSLPTPTTAEAPTPVAAKPAAATPTPQPVAAAAKATTPKPAAPVMPVKKPIAAKPAAPVAARKPLAAKAAVPAAATPTPQPVAAAAKAATPKPAAPVMPVKKPLPTRPAAPAQAPAVAAAASSADVAASPSPEPAPALAEAAAAGRIEELKPEAVQPMRVASADVGDFIGEVRKTQPASFGDVVAASLGMSFGRS